MQETCLDLGWQTIGTGHPVVVKLPRPAVAGAMFGKLGMGAGGGHLTQKPDSQRQILMAKGALGPPSTAWVHATNRDLGPWKEKIQGLVRGFMSQSNPKMGGFRIEVRVPRSTSRKPPTG